MGKPDQELVAAEGARRATGDVAGRGRGGRLSARRKRETVLRLLRGEDLESVSRELGSRRRGPRSGVISFWWRARPAICSGRRQSSAASQDR